MKEPSEKTKVVVRHLPPSLTHSDLSVNVDEKFSSRVILLCLIFLQNIPVSFCRALSFFLFFLLLPV
ncbi:hypothetical protein ACB094_09G083300 [Castanea mollissima]